MFVKRASALVVILTKFRSAFLALVLMSLMVLHNAEGNGMEEAMEEVVARSQNGGGLSPQVRGHAFC